MRMIGKVQKAAMNDIPAKLSESIKERREGLQNHKRTRRMLGDIKGQIRE